MALNKKKAAAIGQFVQFAYDMFDEGGLQPAPVQGIANRGYELVYWLNATDSLWPDFNEQKKFYGYIAVSKTNAGDVILAIRGTRGAQEWVMDFLALPVPFSPAPEKGLVALGFLAIFDSFELVDQAGNTTTLQGAITQLNAANPIETLTVIGHSLGSALATLSAAELTFLDVAGVQDTLSLWTFASPAVGLLNFALSFDAAINSATRIWNVLDIVPYVPPLPYTHVSGLGNPLFQSAQQLEQLVVSPGCEHVLPDYLWLLDPANFALKKGCSVPAVPSPQVTAGARALRKAMTGAFDSTGAPRTVRKQVAKRSAKPKKRTAQAASKSRVHTPKSDVAGRTQR